MHTRNLFSFLMALLVPFSLFAQSQSNPAKIVWGKETTEPQNTMLSKIVSWNKDNFYALRVKDDKKAESEGPSRIFLERYNSSMNLEKSKELSLKFKKKKRQFEEMMMIGGQLYLFTSFNNQAKRKIIFLLSGLASRLYRQRRT